MIVVTGAAGQLGTAFRGVVPDARFLTRADLDLTDPAATAAMVRSLRPSLVVNCAAYTAVDTAESEPEVARTVNAVAVGRMAGAARDVGAGFVTFSTDYVFDGTSPDPYVESSECRPINVYGATKREGELLALEEHPDALVIRTSWVLSGTHRNFAATMLHHMRNGPVRVVDDQRGHPTLVDDLAPAVMAAVQAGATGVLHLTNAGPVTWYELTLEIAECAGLDPGLVSPCSSFEFPRPAPRPANSVLVSERLPGLGLEPMPHHRPALERAVAALAAR